MENHFLRVRVISLLLPLLLAAGCGGDRTVDPESIDSAQAHAALMKGRVFKVLVNDDNDPVVRGVRDGPITPQPDGTIIFRRFVHADLKAKTWRFRISNPKMHFLAEAEGVFERQPDGSWLAVTRAMRIS